MPALALSGFVEQLASIDVEGVEPMTSVVPTRMQWRKDEVVDHAGASVVVANAPAGEGTFFTVPKVIE